MELNKSNVYLKINRGMENIQNLRLSIEDKVKKEASCIQCNIMIPFRLKDKIYETVMRLMIFYGIQCQAVNTKSEQKE